MKSESMIIEPRIPLFSHILAENVSAELLLVGRSRLSHPLEVFFAFLAGIPA